MNETKLDISTPKEELPTKGFSVIVEAPQGYPIRDNARGKIIALCSELSEATRIARALASQPELLEALQGMISAMWQHWEYYHDGEDEMDNEACQRALDKARAAIAKATGGAA